MNNAGLIYNNIIYDKAPVVLEKIVEIMGEQAFRKGIHDYLTEFSYGNASWDDLIGILDKKSNTNLATFSNTWVNSKGMPHIEFRHENDSIRILQSDPYNRGLLWRQDFNVTLIGDTSIEVNINMDCEKLTIPLTEEIDYILPNSDGRGYGYFIYDNRSMAWVLENWHNIEDENCRQAQLMNLHEAYQHNEIKAERWLLSLVNGLAHENNPLIASTVCNYINRPLSEVKNGDIEKALLSMTRKHRLTSCRLQLLRTLITSANDSTVCDSLYRIWEAGIHPLLNENDYMNMAYELAIRFPDRHAEIIDRQRDRISNPDRLRQFDFVSRAVVPDTIEQEKLFHSLLIAENRSIEPWALKALGYLCHPLREAQAIKYIRPALDALQDIQRTSDIFFPQSWARTLLGECNSIEALQEAEEFLNDNPDYPILLKNKILQAAWDLQRRAGKMQFTTTGK